MSKQNKLTEEFLDALLRTMGPHKYNDVMPALWRGLGRFHKERHAVEATAAFRVYWSQAVKSKQTNHFFAGALLGYMVHEAFGQDPIGMRKFMEDLKQSTESAQVILNSSDSPEEALKKIEAVIGRPVDEHTRNELMKNFSDAKKVADTRYEKNTNTTGDADKEREAALAASRAEFEESRKAFK